MQEVGAALFQSLEPTAVSRQAPIAAARAAEADAGASASPAPNRGDVPLHLVPFVGISLDDVPWKPLAPGIWHCPLPLSKGAKGDLRLIKVAPGKVLPEHGHRGEELTLLLRGSYRDETGTYAAGDIADLDESIEHKPVADAETGCICLIASEKKARFKGLIARLMQPFIGM